jgi:hypothetical protein
MKLLSTFLCLALSFCLLSTPPVARSAAPVNLVILYMNHGPMQPTIRNLQELLGEYHGKVTAQWFDADKASGKDFMKRKKIHGHIPILILVNGKKSFSINGKDITFQGFPTGASPFKTVEGNWAIADLRQLLNNLTK